MQAFLALLLIVLVFPLSAQVPLTHENLTVGALCITSTLRRQREDVYPGMR